MPRTPTPITHEFPYHVVARSNNKEWFDLPMQESWMIFSRQLNKAIEKFEIQIFAFVLMRNHYHMILQTTELFVLPKVMEWYQRSVCRQFNNKSGRINHLFGGPYKASVITDDNYFYNAMKYVYRNPVQSGEVEDVRDYNFSTLNNRFIRTKRPPFGPFYSFTSAEDYVRDLNRGYSTGTHSIIKKALNRRKMQYPARISSHVVQELQPKQVRRT